MAFHTHHQQREDPNLVWIETPQTREQSIVTAQKVYEMCKSDFSLSVLDMARLLDCQPLWIRLNVQPYVKHIFINRYFRAFMKELYPDDQTFSHKNLYYFSRQGFREWMIENTQAKRTTVLLRGQQAKVYRKAHPNYTSVKFKDRVGHECSIQAQPPERLISIKSITTQMGIHTPEMAYRHLFAIGAIKFIVCNALVRYHPNVVKKEASASDVLLFHDMITD